MKKKIIIIITILIVLFLTIFIISDKATFKNYKKIDSKDNLLEVNHDYIDLTTHTIDNKNEEREYIEKLSSSLILGYMLYSSPFTDGETIIKNMEELELLNLTYIFMTNDQDSVCISEDYLKEMIHRYFRIDKDSFSKEVKNYLYSNIKHGYCFDSIEFDNSALNLVDYKNTNGSIILKYREVNEYEDEIYEWNIKFNSDSEGYYLYSFSNIIVS